jgi:hypothetical protein
MTTKTYLPFAVSAGVALGIAALGSPARADQSSASSAPSTQAAAASGQQRIGETTWALENAFKDQFVRGAIDRTALAAPIDEVLKAMPEAARPQVQAHIERVLATAEKLASQMTPEDRATAAAPPAAERVGTAAQAQFVGWGWPGAAGWGGYGAFGFPGMAGWGTGLGMGWGGMGLGWGW